MKKYWKLIFPLLFGFLVVLGNASVHLVEDIRDYSSLINYVGIVRGASQRAVKLEMNGEPDDELVSYVDGILTELITGKGQYGLVMADSEEYRQNLGELEVQWDKVKNQILLVRRGANASTLLSDSEELFRIANNTVFSIEEYSNRKAEEATELIFVSAIFCGIAFAAVIFHYVRQFFQLKKTNEMLAYQAGRDEMTGAYNSEKFYELMDRIMKTNSNDKFAVLYIDFENFKYVNDVFGYNYGDQLLRKYAQLMLENLRDKELLCHSFADHFFVLRRYRNKEELLTVQMEVDQKFAAAARNMPNRHVVTIACGICCVEDAEEEADDTMLINRANFAQKMVKNRPDNHYAFYDEKIRQKMIEENTLKNRMQEALEKKEFLVYMQPKVGVQEGIVKSAEALVRWQMPGRGMLPPGEFIPLLEKNHFISQVDQYVFEAVCIWLRGRIDRGEIVVPISVNVSKIQFYNPEFVSIYSKMKEKYQIPDGMLEIEFTETVAFEHGEYMLQIVKELHDHGFSCSMDDFGTGYSSLSMLKDLPIDVLKLDGMFFRVSVNVQKEHTILKRVIQMIRELDICTVAEGVEHAEQVEFLKEVGCDLIQGYYYYKPMCIADFELVLDSLQKNAAGS